jgi:hypothetical protein
MTKPARERWCFVFELPADVGNTGRFMAMILKHLLRVWRVRATAIRKLQDHHSDADHGGVGL